MVGVTYNRYSSDNQRAESIDAQLRFNYDYAKKNDIEVIKDYIDEAISGKSDDRPAFKQMLEDAKNGLFDVVICHKVDRFARNRIESAINKYNLGKCKVKVVFSGQSIDDSPEGQLMEGILESFAEYYSLNLAKETMKGLKENAYKCKFNGGIPPLGYNIDPVTKQYVINEEEAYYVKFIFTRFLQGYKYKTIISELDALGVKTRAGKGFLPTSLHELLKNEKYCGIYTFNKRVSRTMDGKRNNRSSKAEDEIIRIPGGIPAIIDTETFIKAQEKFELRQRTTRANEFYLLTGLVYCGICGKPYCGGTKHNGSGKVYTMYRCNGRCKSNKDMYRDDLEALVYKKLIENIFSKAALEGLSKKLNEYLKAKKVEENKRLDFLKNRMNELKSEQDNIVNAIMRGYDQPIFKQKLTEIDENIKKIKYEYEIIKIKLEQSAITPKDIDAKLQEQRNHILNRDMVSVKQFIANYIESIIVYPEDIEINLKFDEVPLS